MKKANIGWIGLGAYVGAYDVWACSRGHESLSGAFWRGMEHPQFRFAIGVATGLLVKHLMAPRVLPQIDPLNHVGRKLRERGNECRV